MSWELLSGVGLIGTSKGNSGQTHVVHKFYSSQVMWYFFRRGHHHTIEEASSYFAAQRRIDPFISYSAQ